MSGRFYLGLDLALTFALGAHSARWLQFLFAESRVLAITQRWENGYLGIETTLSTRRIQAVAEERRDLFDVTGCWSMIPNDNENLCAVDVLQTGPE